MCGQPLNLGPNILEHALGFIEQLRVQRIKTHIDLVFVVSPLFRRLLCTKKSIRRFDQPNHGLLLRGDLLTKFLMLRHNVALKVTDNRSKRPSSTVDANAVLKRANLESVCWACQRKLDCNFLSNFPKTKLILLTDSWCFASTTLCKMLKSSLHSTRNSSTWCCCACNCSPRPSVSCRRLRMTSFARSIYGAGSWPSVTPK